MKVGVPVAGLLHGDLGAFDGLHRAAVVHPAPAAVDLDVTLVLPASHALRAIGVASGGLRPAGRVLGATGALLAFTVHVELAEVDRADMRLVDVLRRVGEGPAG